MNYNKTLEYIDSLKTYGIVPGLDSIRRLCDCIGNPQNDLKFIHISGTNGKGSVLAYISSILSKAGYKTGRYSSPAVFEYREKIQVSEKMISKAAVCEGMEIIKAACDKMVLEGYDHPTPFEAETALAFWYFKKKHCDFVVLETGMGGLMDATNIINTTCVSVIASIGMDHMQFLGDTIEKIAAHKAGIIKPSRPVVTMPQPTGAMRVIEEKCAQGGSSLYVSDKSKLSHVKYGITKQKFDYKEYRGLEISLAGRYQIDNAMLAIEAVRAIENEGCKIKEGAVRDGLKETRWPGRFCVIQNKPLFIVDGAHNEDAAVKLADSIEFYFTNKRIIYIMGILRDKEYEKIISVTEKYAAHILTVAAPDNPRAMPAYELAKEIAGLHPDVTACDSIEEAVEMSRLLAGKDDVIIAFGSLSYLGRLMEIVADSRKK